MRSRFITTAMLALLGCVGDDSVSTDAGGNDATIDTPALGFCATHTSSTTMICADFDTTLDAGWTTAVTFEGGTMALEQTDFVSPPNGFVVTLPANANPAAAMLELDPVGAPSAFSGVLRMSVRVPACFKGGDVITVADFQFFQSNVQVYDVGLQIAVNGSLFVYAGNFAESGINGQTYGANQLMPLNTWVALELDLTMAGTPHANLIQNAQIVASTDLLPGNAPGLPRFLLGAQAPKLTSSTCNIELDNVTLDRQ